MLYIYQFHHHNILRHMGMSKSLHQRRFLYRFLLIYMYHKFLQRYKFHIHNYMGDKFHHLLLHGHIQHLQHYM